MLAKLLIEELAIKVFNSEYTLDEDANLTFKRGLDIVNSNTLTTDNVFPLLVFTVSTLEEEVNLQRNLISESWLVDFEIYNEKSNSFNFDVFSELDLILRTYYNSELISDINKGKVTPNSPYLRQVRYKIFKDRSLKHNK